MPKRHLYLDGEYKLHEEGSESYKQAVKDGWGLDRDASSSSDDKEIDLNTLDMEELHKLAKEADLKVANNIGREKLIKKLMEI